MPIKGGAHVLGAFHGIGFVSVGFGIEPLHWSEIHAYAQLTGELSEPWEARAVRSMSEAYCRWRNLGKNALCVTPDEATD